jgi:UDP-glucose 4-epimerase
MKTCLVTGARGHIGSHLVQNLATDYPVHAVTRSLRTNDVAPKNINYIPIDFSQHWGTDQLPDGPLDALVHLAQSEHFRDFPDSALSVFQVNTESTIKLLDYAQKVGVKSVVLASTGGVYSPGDEICHEDTALSLGRNLGFYANTKLCAELLAESYTPYFNVIILRFFFVYGPGQRDDMLIPRLVQSVKGGRPIALQGENGLHINPTHVSDAVNSIRASFSLTESQAINVGGPDILSLRQIGQTIGHALNREPQFDVNPAQIPKDLIADISRMSDLLGAPKIRFANGIQSYIQETETQNKILQATSY